MNMVRKSEPLSQLRAGAVEIVRLLRQAGFEAYWAGGCVRDMLLGESPADYDIATSAQPDEVLSLFPRCVEVGKAFGVIQVLNGDDQYDVATFRAEGSYTDGRRPDAVTWADPREDVIRRDFSINGLLYDPLNEKVIDFVDGESDLRAGVVRAIGDPTERFNEDALRILRALRFSARLGFRIETNTWTALKKVVPTITKISAERIRYELERILTEGGAEHGLRMLQRVGLWEILLPELRDPEAAIKRFGPHKGLKPRVAWACLLLDQHLSVGSLRDLGKRMRLSRQLIDRILGIIECANAVGTYGTLEVWDRKKLVRHESFTDVVHLLITDNALASSLSAAQTERANWSEGELHPKPLLSGSDLAQAGHSPGPFYGQILSELENRQLSGAITTRTAALNFVAQRAKETAN